MADARTGSYPNAKHNFQPLHFLFTEKMKGKTVEQLHRTLKELNENCNVDDGKKTSPEISS